MTAAATVVTCSHPRCGQPLFREYAQWKPVAGLPGRQPFHAACFYAGPTHDVTTGVGSPFTTISGGVI